MLPEMARLRQSFDQPHTRGKSPSQLCTMLGSQLSKTIRLRTILELAAQAPELDSPSHIFRPGSKLSGLKIALAYDPSIDGYYSDVLDLLELQGAEVADFSPLRDQSLPPGAEVVYFGCGNPQRYARKLSENHCLKFALRDHVRQGKRVYAEGGGAAYLCQQLVTASGMSWPMAGLLPAVAHYQEIARQPTPLELTLTRDHWLGRRGAQLRGYDSGHWRWESTSEMDRGLALANDGSSPMLTSEGVVGNKVSINFAAQPHFLARFSSRVSHSQRAISIA
jgi:cobyrinic acid a,c-diamide synthase